MSHQSIVYSVRRNCNVLYANSEQFFPRDGTANDQNNTDYTHSYTRIHPDICVSHERIVSRCRRKCHTQSQKVRLRLARISIRISHPTFTDYIFPILVTPSAHRSDLGQIYTRIYDPKPFVQAEISAFVREFEVLVLFAQDSADHVLISLLVSCSALLGQLKRNDREVEHLFGSLETTSDICDSGLTRCTALSRVHLPELRSVVAQTLAQCHQAQQTAAAAVTGSSGKFEQQRAANCARRAESEQRFEADVTHKRSRIDNTFEEKEEELREFYTDLASKLRVHN